MTVTESGLVREGGEGRRNGHQSKTTCSVLVNASRHRWRGARRGGSAIANEVDGERDGIFPTKDSSNIQIIAAKEDWYCAPDKRFSTEKKHENCTSRNEGYLCQSGVTIELITASASQRQTRDVLYRGS